MGLSKEFREAQMCRLRDIENQNKYDEFICKFDDYQRNAGKGSGELSVREDLENNFAKYGVFYQPGYLAREVCRFNLNPRSSDFPKDYDGVVNLVNSLNGKSTASDVSDTGTSTATSVSSSVSPQVETVSTAAATPEAAVSPATALPNNTANTDVFGGTQLGKKGFYFPTESDITDEERRFHDYMKYRNLGNLSREEKINVTNAALEAAQNSNFTPYPSVPPYPYDEKTSQCLRPQPLMQCLEPWKDEVRRYKENCAGYRQGRFDLMKALGKFSLGQRKLEKEEDCQRKYLADYDLNTPARNLEAGLSDTYDIVNKYSTWGNVVNRTANGLLSPALGEGKANDALTAIDTVSGVLSGRENPMEKMGEMAKDDLIRYGIQKSSDIMGAGYNQLFNRDVLDISQNTSCNIDEVNHDIQRNFSDFQPQQSYDWGNLPLYGNSVAQSATASQKFINNHPQFSENVLQKFGDLASKTQGVTGIVNDYVRPISNFMGGTVVSSKLLRSPWVAGALGAAALGNTAYEGYQNNKLRQEERKNLNDYFEPRIAAAQQQSDANGQQLLEADKLQRSYGQALDNSMQDLNRKTGSSYKFNRY